MAKVAKPIKPTDISIIAEARLAHKQIYRLERIIRIHTEEKYGNMLRIKKELEPLVNQKEPDAIESE